MTVRKFNKESAQRYPIRVKTKLKYFLAKACCSFPGFVHKKKSCGLLSDKWYQ